MYAYSAPNGISSRQIICAKSSTPVDREPEDDAERWEGRGQEGQKQWGKGEKMKYSF